MKKHNALKVVLISLLVVLVLSWIFPAAYFSGEYIDQGRIQMGLADVYNYIAIALQNFGHYSLYIIFVGCFYGVLYKIPAYRAFLDKVVEKVNSKVFIVITVILFALGVSVAGLQVAFAIFIPLVVSLILLMGYDKIVAALVVVGSLAAGLIGSTYAYGNNGFILYQLGLEPGYQVWVRFIILLVAVVILIFNIFMYIHSKQQKKVVVEGPKKADALKEEKVVEAKASSEVKVAHKIPNPKASSKDSSDHDKKSGTTPKRTTNGKGSNKPGPKGNKPATKSSKGNGTRKNANKAALRDEDIIVVKASVTTDHDDEGFVPAKVESNSKKIWPLVVGFILLFVLLVVSYITWGDNGFGISFFDNITENVSSYTLGEAFRPFAIYGTVSSFGNWTVIDLIFPSVLLLAIWAFVYRLKFDEILDGVVSGARKAFLPAVIAILVYTVLVAAVSHPFQLVFYKAILGITKGFNPGSTVVVTALSALFNVDPVYVYQSVLPYYASVVTDTNTYPLVGVIAQSMYGLVSCIAPTSFILMTSLAFLKVNYKDWLKSAWKLFLELFIVLLIIFIIMTFI